MNKIFIEAKNNKTSEYHFVCQFEIVIKEKQRKRGKRVFAYTENAGERFAVHK